LRLEAGNSCSSFPTSNDIVSPAIFFLRWRWAVLHRGRHPGALRLHNTGYPGRRIAHLVGAKEMLTYRFYALYDKLYPEDVLAHAWRLANANGGISVSISVSATRITARPKPNANMIRTRHKAIYQDIGII
jgi:hypothetical protein